MNEGSPGSNLLALSTTRSLKIPSRLTKILHGDSLSVVLFRMTELLGNTLTSLRSVIVYYNVAILYSTKRYMSHKKMCMRIRLGGDRFPRAFGTQNQGEDGGDKAIQWLVRRTHISLQQHNKGLQPLASMADMSLLNLPIPDKAFIEAPDTHNPK